MASVWIARQTGKHGFEKLVAVKTVLPKFASDERFQSMFIDEARIASRIEHANVAQILDVGEQLDTTYLVMEYVDGEALATLQRALKKKGARMPPGVLLRIMADICGGLHAAHELRDASGQLLGVVHRDVSPQNVLCSMKGVAKLIDFGVAKARDRIAGDTNAGTVKGKVRYMAPEQALGHNIDRRADIWGIGAILYHLLSGKPPYDGDNDVQTLLVLTSGRPPVPLPMSVPRPIAAVVKRALSPSPDGRFATAAEMQLALEDAMVETKLSTTPQVVAAFLAEHIADRAQRRKDAIALGLKAATDREKYAELMRSNLRTTGAFSPSKTGVSYSVAPPGVGDQPSLTSVPGTGTETGSRSGTSAPGTTAPGGSAPGGSVPGISAPGTSGHGMSPSGASAVSGGTLGSAALELGAKRHLSRRTMAIAGVAAALVAAGVLLLTVGAKQEPAASAAAKASTPVSTVASPPAPPSTAARPAATASPTPPVATAPAPSAPTIAFDKLPPATSAAPTAPIARPPVLAAPPQAAIRPPTKPAPKATQRIDDGF